MGTLIDALRAKLDMTVADGIKYIVSLGSIAPELPSAAEKRR